MLFLRHYILLGQILAEILRLLKKEIEQQSIDATNFKVSTFLKLKTYFGSFFPTASPFLKNVLNDCTYLLSTYTYTKGDGPFRIRMPNVGFAENFYLIN